MRTRRLQTPKPRRAAARARYHDATRHIPRMPARMKAVRSRPSPAMARACAETAKICAACLAERVASEKHIQARVSDVRRTERARAYR